VPTDPFPRSALDANRSGHLTPDQAVLYRQEAATDRRTALFAGVAIAAFGALIVAGGVTGKAPGSRVETLLIGVALLGVGLVVAYFAGIQGAKAKAAAARTGTVTMIEGPFTRDRRDRRDIFGADSGHYSPGNEYEYYLLVGDRRFTVAQEAWDAAPADGVVRVYLLGTSDRIVNLEKIADAPPPQVPGFVRMALERAATSSDPEKAAEARAMLRQAELMTGGAMTPAGGAPAPAPFPDVAAPGAPAAMPLSLGPPDAGPAATAPIPAATAPTPIPTAPIPAAVPAAPTAPLEQAILGTWRSDLMRMTFEFRSDGIVVATSAKGESREQRWSPGAPGTIVLEGQALQAVVSGDELAMGEAPRLLSFRRVG